MNNKEFRKMCDLELKVKRLNRALSNIGSLADDALAAVHTNHHNVTKERLMMINVAITAVDPTLLPSRPQIKWRNIA